MRTFTLFTTDPRYNVPTLTLVVVEDEHRAIELAKVKLAQSDFHLAVELYDGARPIYRTAKPMAGPAE